MDYLQEVFGEISFLFFVINKNKLFLLDWTIIRRVFIRARQQFGVQHKDIDIKKPDMLTIEVISILFNIFIYLF